MKTARTTAKRTWLFLIYKVPRQPTASRVYVWRKLRQLGALLLQDAVWVLPATPRTREQLQWLATEIAELQGEVTLWEARAVFGDEDESLAKRFQEQSDKLYQQILAGLKRKRRDLSELARQFQQAQAEDYFPSQLGERVRRALLAAREGTST